MVLAQRIGQHRSNEEPCFSHREEVVAFPNGQYYNKNHATRFACILLRKHLWFACRFRGEQRRAFLQLVLVCRRCCSMLALVGLVNPAPGARLPAMNRRFAHLLRAQVTSSVACHAIKLRSSSFGSHTKQTHFVFGTAKFSKSISAWPIRLVHTTRLLEDNKV